MQTTIVDFSTSNSQVVDEIINVSDSNPVRLIHDIFYNKTGKALRISTGAGGTGTVLTDVTDYSAGGAVADSLFPTSISPDVGYSTIAILNATYHDVDLYVAYYPIADTFNATRWNYMLRRQVERRLPVGSLIPNVGKLTPTAWAGDPDTYEPSVCMTDFDTHEDLTATNYPDLVPFLRSQKTIYKDGLTGELEALVVTNWAISSNVATLTFQNDADHIAVLTALLEDNSVHGGYTNWRSITLPATIGTITAGDYAITGINATSRTITFAFTASNGSGAVTSSAEFYGFRIPGSTTSARLWSMRGKSLIGVGDSDGYFSSGGLRSRGYMQGHWHDMIDDVSALTTKTPKTSNVSSGSNWANGGNPIGNPRTDGTNGTPRTRKETHSPSAGVLIYMHVGRFE